MSLHHLFLSTSLLFSLPGFSQEYFHTIGLITDEEILLDNARPLFTKHKAREIYLTLKDNSNNQKNETVLDTVFYGLNREGYVHYFLLQLFGNKSKKGNRWMGYDTTYFPASCSPLYFCEKMEPDSYDSIQKEPGFRKVFITYNHKQTRLTNLFNEKGKLTEQQVQNKWMDGSSTYKAHYIYDDKGRLGEIQYYNISRTKNQKTGDPFIDHDFDLLAKKRFVYGGNGQLLTMTYYSRRNNEDPFNLSHTVYYEYIKGLPASIRYVTEGPGSTVEQVMGYKYFDRN